ncbi:MAG: 50S ribosomal protein L23 [Cellvibrionales bacterium TMED49]|nr:50S ribosomal protein L23 [Porticoccaceae bacterium]OUU39233.1 MAG: 50S ribosomal protein L23 [Cellvibrionales bacterium TMED49]
MNEERVYKVILGQHITEKSASTGGESNLVVFKVAPDSTKVEIKKAVQKLFLVDVEDVRVVGVKGKLRRTKHGFGKRSDWKKAYVRLSTDSNLDLAVIE